MITWHGKLWVTDKQCTVTRVASGKHDHSYTSVIPLLSHDLSYSILAGWIDACQHVQSPTFFNEIVYSLGLNPGWCRIILVVSNPFCTKLTCFNSKSICAVRKNSYQITVGCNEDEYHFESTIRNAGNMYTSVIPPICLEVCYWGTWCHTQEM